MQRASEQVIIEIERYIAAVTAYESAKLARQQAADAENEAYQKSVAARTCLCEIVNLPKDTAPLRVIHGDRIFTFTNYSNATTVNHERIDQTTTPEPTR